MNKSASYLDVLVGFAVGQELVKHMVVSLAFGLVRYARMLQQPVLQTAAGNGALFAESNSNKFAETRRVEVVERARVAKGLENDVCFQNLSLKKKNGNKIRK